VHLVAFERLPASCRLHQRDVCGEQRGAQPGGWADRICVRIKPEEWAPFGRAARCRGAQRCDHTRGGHTVRARKDERIRVRMRACERVLELAGGELRRGESEDRGGHRCAARQKVRGVQD
jgi:hypothetical protein